MVIFDILGYLGMILIIMSLVPQLVKTYREKKVENISVLFPLTQVVAGLCMIPYGVYLDSIQIIVINLGMLINASVLLIQIYYYRNNGLDGNNGEEEESEDDEII